MIKNLLIIGFVIATHVSFAGVQELLKSGDAKIKAGNFQEAVYDFSAAIELNSEQTQKHLKTLEQYANLSAFEKASVENAELIEERHDLAVPYYSRGLAYIGLGNKEDALKDFEMAVKIDAKYGDAWCELGLVKHAMGKKDDGCIDLRTAADLGSAKGKDEYENKFCWNTSLNYVKEGKSKLRLKQYEAALTDFNIAVKLNPDSASNYMNRGLCYYGLGKFDKALLDFQSAAQVDPTKADYVYYKGLVLFSQENHQAAFDEFSKAIKLDINHYNSYLYRGYTCEALGNFKSGIYDFTQAIRIKPGDALAYYRCGLLKQEMKDQKGACADFRKAAELGNEDAEGYAAECK
jgi:tetratricopeptide (TPR) repeat protein